MTTLKPEQTETEAQRHVFRVQHEAISERDAAALVAAFTETNTRSVVSPKRPARRWIPSRVCRCGGGCRFKPRGVCFGDENPIQLYVTEPWGGL